MSAFAIAATDGHCRRRAAPSSMLFCVKSLDTEDARAARWRRTCAPDAVVLSLQNGVDNVERIRRHIKNQVIPVLIYAAAEMPEPGYGAAYRRRQSGHRADE